MKKFFLFLMALIFINFGNINVSLAKSEKNSDTVVVVLDDVNYQGLSVL